MPSLKETFPGWYLRSRVTDATTWNEAFDVQDGPTIARAIHLLRDDIAKALEVEGPSRARAVGLDLVVPLVGSVEHHLRPWTLDERILEQLAGLLLITAASGHMAEAAFAIGDTDLARDWLLLPLGGEVGAATLAPGRGGLFFVPDQPLGDGLVIEGACRWAESLFVYARYFGNLDVVCDRTFEFLQQWLTERLPEDVYLGYLSLAAVEWSVRRPIDDAVLTAATFAFMQEERAELELQRALETHFAETAHLRGLDPVEECLRVLRKFDRQLTGTQRLRMMSTMAIGRPQSAPQNLGMLTRTIDVVMADWRTTTPADVAMAIRRGAYFNVVGNMLEALIVAERPDLLGELLGAWLEVPPADRRRDLLFWFATESPGMGWAAGHTVSLRDADVSPTVLIDALARFIGVTISIRDLPGYEPPVPTGRPGLPNPHEVGEFADVLERFVHLPQLRAVLYEEPPMSRSLVAIPYAGLPVQPLILKHYGRTWPWTVSLRTPLPDRRARSARVIVSGTAFGPMEGSGVRSVLESGGIDVELVDDAELGADQFLELYRDPGPDIIWVIGHGQFDRDQPADSNLAMPDGTAVHASSLVHASAQERRLLVLNVCDAALAMVSGGLPEFGLGAMAAHPGQAVIGHLWPVLGWPDGALIGRLLAGQLTDSDSWFAAYERTMRLVLEGRDAVLRALDGRAGDLDDELRPAMEGRHGDRLAEISTWGSLAFLE